jgi:hypothetical protein
MAQSLPARAPDGWSRHDAKNVTVMVNEGGTLADLGAPPDACLTVRPDGCPVVTGPTGSPLVLIASVELGDGRGLKVIFCAPTPPCAQEGCGLHAVTRGVSDRHECLPVTTSTSLEIEAHDYIACGVRQAAAEGLDLAVTFTTPEDLVDLIVATGAIGSKVILDPPPSVTKGWVS